MPFKVRLERRDEGKVHKRNLQKLMLEIFKFRSEENPSFMWTFFEMKSIDYELRTKSLSQLPNRNAGKVGVNSFEFKVAHLWRVVPDTKKMRTQR